MSAEAARQDAVHALPRRFAARDGALLAYRYYPGAAGGDAGGAVVVLLPGFALASRDYVRFCGALARVGPSVYSPDLRGHGDSQGRPGDVDYVGQLADDLADLCAQARREHPGRTLVLCGHSSGCSLAIATLTRTGHALGVEALFLVAPVFCGYLEYDRHQVPIYRASHTLRYRRRPVPAVSPVPPSGQQFRYYLWRSLLGRLLPGHQRQIVLSVDIGGSTGWQHFTRRFYDSYRCTKLPRRLAQIPCPVWAMVGADDEFSQPESVVSALRWHVAPRLLRETRLIKGAGHFSIFRSASLVMAGWVRALPQAPGRRRVAA